MLLLNLTGCSLSFGRKNLSTDKSNNNINREIIKNYSKGLSREPNNFFFYLERGRAKHEYGDFKGAINDFNYAFKIYNSNNELESTFEVGLFPGDFAYWEFEEN